MKKNNDKADPLSIAGLVASVFTQGWNNRDGAGFAQPFADDAQFVTVYGGLLQSKIAIAEGHQFILDTVFKNSFIVYKVLNAVFIDSNTILAHITGDGTINGGHGQAIMTLVIINNPAGWQVRALQNTTVSSGPIQF